MSKIEKIDQSLFDKVYNFSSKSFQTYQEIQLYADEEKKDKLFMIFSMYIIVLEILLLMIIDEKDFNKNLIFILTILIIVKIHYNQFFTFCLLMLLLIKTISELFQQNNMTKLMLQSQHRSVSGFVMFYLHYF